MTTVTQLISSRVVLGYPEQRLSYLTEKIEQVRAQYCVVLEPSSGSVVGLVNFADLASRPSAALRIFADLMQPPPPLRVNEGQSSREVETLFAKHGLQEIMVLSSASEFVGLITPDSYCQWLMKLRQD